MRIRRVVSTSLKSNASSTTAQNLTSLSNSAGWSRIEQAFPALELVSWVGLGFVFFLAFGQREMTGEERDEEERDGKH